MDKESNWIRGNRVFSAVYGMALFEKITTIIETARCA
jgi:hypothetical protein